MIYNRFDSSGAARLYAGEPFTLEIQLQDEVGFVEELDGRVFQMVARDVNGTAILVDGAPLAVPAAVAADAKGAYAAATFSGAQTAGLLTAIEPNYAFEEVLSNGTDPIVTGGLEVQPRATVATVGAIPSIAGVSGRFTRVIHRNVSRQTIVQRGRAGFTPEERLAFTRDPTTGLPWISAPTVEALSAYARAPAEIAAQAADAHIAAVTLELGETTSQKLGEVDDKIAQTEAERQASIAQRGAIAGDLAGKQPASSVLATLVTRGQAYIPKVYADDLPGFVAGTVTALVAIENARIINRYLLTSARATLRMREGGLYCIGETIRPMALVGGGSGANRAILRMDRVAFNNRRSGSAYRGEANALAIRSGVFFNGAPQLFTRFENFILDGNRAIGENAQDVRFLQGMSIANSLDVMVGGVDMVGFPGAVGMVLASLGDGAVIDHCRMLDFLMNADYGDGLSRDGTATFGGTFSNAGGQVTGFEVDNNVVPGVGSSRNIRFNTCTVKKMATGPISRQSGGDQSDGFNFARPGALGCEGHTIIDPLVEDVNEGLDNFASYCRVIGGRFLRCRNAGLKTLYGASYNIYDGQEIRDSGLSAINIGASTVEQGATRFNQYRNIMAVGINDVAGQYGLGDGSCLRISPATAAQSATHVEPFGTTFDNIHMEPGAGTAGVCWRDEASYAGGGHVGRGIRMIPGTGPSWSRRAVISARAAANGSKIQEVGASGYITTDLI